MHNETTDANVRSDSPEILHSTIEVLWGSSKDIIAIYTDKLIALLSQDEYFAKQISAASFDSSFIKNLGHSRRGFEDFPSKFPIKLDNISVSEVDSQMICNGKISIKSFYNQLATFIAKYYKELRSEETNDNEKIAVLCNIAHVMSDESLQLMSNVYVKHWQIIGMKSSQIELGETHFEK